MSQKRSIFEEVSESSDTNRPSQGGMIDKGQSGARGAIRIWLALLFLLVTAMIVVGGLTRLTDSGLSIVEWAPFSGALPPMNEADWTTAFEAYRQIPEYQLQNQGMSLAEFQRIFWWEWGHRQLGRVIGLVWAVGFFGFLATRSIPNGWTGRLFLLGVLGGIQGAIGWWMVSSGLTGTMLDVASYRLAIHLGLAFVILGLITWYWLKLARRDADLLQARRARDARLNVKATGLMHFIFLQILIGALVAGIDAGRAFPQWPLMAGGILPPDPFGITPIWRNFFENAGLVQFVHRMLGYVIFLYGIYAWYVSRSSGNGATRFAFNLILALLVLQIALGIVTVLTMASLHPAIAHQIGAILLWIAVIRARFLTQYPLTQSVRGT